MRMHSCFLLIVPALMEVSLHTHCWFRLFDKLILSWYMTKWMLVLPCKNKIRIPPKKEKDQNSTKRQIYRNRRHQNQKKLMLQWFSLYILVSYDQFMKRSFWYIFTSVQTSMGLSQLSMKEVQFNCHNNFFCSFVYLFSSHRWYDASLKRIWGEKQPTRLWETRTRNND